MASWPLTQRAVRWCSVGLARSSQGSDQQERVQLNAVARFMAGYEILSVSHWSAVVLLSGPLRSTALSDVMFSEQLSTASHLGGGDLHRLNSHAERVMHLSLSLYDAMDR